MLALQAQEELYIKKLKATRQGGFQRVDKPIGTLADFENGSYIL